MNEPQTLQAVVLAAGKGTRMKSDLPKVLHEIGGRPLLEHVLAAARAAAGRAATVVVVGHQAARVRSPARTGRRLVRQEPQLGTGHAVQVAQDKLARRRLDAGAGGRRPAAAGGDPAAAGRGDARRGRRGDGADLRGPRRGRLRPHRQRPRRRLLKIVEARDATDAERAIGEYNTGVFCFRTADLREALAVLKPGQRPVASTT